MHRLYHRAHRLQIRRRVPNLAQVNFLLKSCLKQVETLVWYGVLLQILPDCKQLQLYAIARKLYVAQRLVYLLTLNKVVEVSVQQLTRVQKDILDQFRVTHEVALKGVCYELNIYKQIRFRDAQSLVLSVVI